METTMLEIEHLLFSYNRGKTILSDLTIKAGEQETIGLIGANGVGKSTLLKLLVGLLDGYEGRISINHQELNKKNLADIRKQAGYVFQDSESQLFLSTVYEDVAFGPENYGYSPAETEKKVMEALKKVHMEELKDRPVYGLSGGEKKLAAIATILSMSPSIILLDEPTVALDPQNRRNLIRILNEMQSLKIIASHDLDMVWDTCERTILLADGRVIKDGATEEILRDKVLLEENGLELPLSLTRR